jgi:predicted aconitase
MTAKLSDKDRGMLDGAYGDAAKLAMTIIIRMADVLDAPELMDITQAHIDGCGLMSDTGLEFAETMARLGGKVSVPTTLNMIPLDLRNWRKLGVPEEFAYRALRMAKAYEDMGCIPTWTCAPYQGYMVPRFGQQIAWGESNAISYANSVYGARTERYADFMDLCAAITGRVPKYGLHLKENRKGEVLIRLVDIDPTVFADDTFYPALGYLVGHIAEHRVPVIDGLIGQVSSDQFKALGATAASSGAVGLYHIVGITPEAATLEEAFQGKELPKAIEVTLQDVIEARENLSTTAEQDLKLDAVVLGCPHFSYDEFRKVAKAIEEQQQNLYPGVRFIILTSQASYALLERSNSLQILTSYGAEIVFDTCIFHSPIISAATRVIMTNSGKCAYYAPGEMNVKVIFGSIEECVRSAGLGIIHREDHQWKSS